MGADLGWTEANAPHPGLKLSMTKFVFNSRVEKWNIMPIVDNRANSNYLKQNKGYVDIASVSNTYLHGGMLIELTAEIKSLN